MDSSHRTSGYVSAHASQAADARKPPAMTKKPLFAVAAWKQTFVEDYTPWLRASASRNPPKRRRYCGADNCTLRRNSRPKKAASS